MAAISTYNLLPLLLPPMVRYRFEDEVGPWCEDAGGLEVTHAHCSSRYLIVLKNSDRQWHILCIVIALSMCREDESWLKQDAIELEGKIY